MTQKRHFAEFRLANAFLDRRARQEDRLPIDATVAVVTSINVALWVLLAFALERLCF